MALPISLQVFLIFVSFLLRTDCKVIETMSTTSSTPEKKTAPPPPYPGCGIRLNREYSTGITGTVIEGNVVGDGDYPWMAFLYNFDRDLVGIDLMDPDADIPIP